MSQLIFNMSVTSQETGTNIGKGKPRYGSPDAPLISCSLGSAVLHLPDRDPRTWFLSPLGLACPLPPRCHTSWPDEPGHRRARPPRPTPALPA